MDAILVPVNDCLWIKHIVITINTGIEMSKISNLSIETLNVKVAKANFVSLLMQFLAMII